MKRTTLLVLIGLALPLATSFGQTYNQWERSTPAGRWRGPDQVGAELNLTAKRSDVYSFYIGGRFEFDDGGCAIEKGYISNQRVDFDCRVDGYVEHIAGTVQGSRMTLNVYRNKKIQYWVFHHEG